MRNLLFVALVLTFVMFLSVNSVFSQDQNSVLILIDSPNFKLLSKIQPLKTYYSDDSCLIGEINANKLIDLTVQNIEFQIIDPQGWSGEYYALTPKPYGPSLEKAKIGDTIYSDENRSIVKIQKQEEQGLFAAGYQLEKITRIPKPLPDHSPYTMAIPTSQDSTIIEIINKVSVISLEAAVQRLENFQTRYTYSDSIVSAAQWIYDQYISYGYADVKFDTFYLNNEPHRNVVATKPGLVYKDSVIMLGGHYDSIVSGEGTDRYVYAPGADDNASGAVAALEAARVLADHEFEATIKFAAWDAEEVGLIGSARYAEKAYSQKEQVGLYMNFDMIGNITPQYTVTIYADAQTMPLADLTANIARMYTSLTPNIPGNSGGSDHRSFQSYGYPAYFVQEGVFSPHWHRVTDVVSNMDFEYMKEVVQMGVATAVFLSGPSDNFYGKPLVKSVDYVINDDMIGPSYGNGNGFIDAGETIEIAILLKNHGDSTAYDITAALSSGDQYITIMDGTQSFGTIISQAVVTNQNSFVIQVSSDAPSGHKTTFDLKINDSRGNSWTDRLYSSIIMPDFMFHRQDASEVSGNGDDKIDPGEIFNLVIEIENTGLRKASGITAILKCEHSLITILDSKANFPNIPKSGMGSNYQDKFAIEINSIAKPEIIPLFLEISEGEGFFQKTISFKLAIGQGKILLVEDDGKFDLSHYYKDALDLLGIPYLHWNTIDRGTVARDTLMKYKRVIWYTGSEFNNSLFSHGTMELQHFLAKGGNLFINGSLFPFSVRDSSILSQYFHTKYISFNTNLHHLKSDGTKPVLGEIDFWLSGIGDNNQGLKGEIDVQSPAQPILFYNTKTSEGAGNIQSSGAAAMAVAENNHRAVMFSFGWEGIDNREIRENVLVKILNWLQGTPTSIGSDLTEDTNPATFDLFQNYPNPFNASTTIRFQLPKASQVTIKIFNILGNEMRTLIQSDLDAGNYRVVWDGKDNRNQTMSSGVYFYKIVAGNFQKTRKMILLY